MRNFELLHKYFVTSEHLTLRSCYKIKYNLIVKMASNDVLSPIPVLPSESQTDNSENIVYLSPAKFKMKLLKRLVSVESKQDLKTASILKRTQSENGLHASIFLPNGEIGTLFSLDNTKRHISRQNSQTDDPESPVRSSKTILPSLALDNVEQTETDTFGLRSPDPESYKRPLKLPPIIMPTVFSTKTYPLAKPELLYRPPPGPITDDEWEELKDCRYLRPAPRRYRDRHII